MRDSTSWQAWIAALEAEVTRWRAVVERSADLLVEVDGEARITHISPAMTKVLGWLPEELLGQPMFAFVHHEKQEVGRARHQAAVLRPVSSASRVGAAAPRDPGGRAADRPAASSRRA